ncbi:hypothetical protein [Bdellovibrio sp. GT3]
MKAAAIQCDLSLFDEFSSAVTVKSAGKIPNVNSRLSMNIVMR